MDVRLDGRVALITGGSLGLGRAMARRFAEAGAIVAIAARRDAPLREAVAEIQADTGSNTVHAFQGDVATADGCDALHKAVTGRLGNIDILVNNAGSSKRGPFLDQSDAVWQEDLDLKLFAAIRLCRLALPSMKSEGWGRIINVLNIGAKAPAGEGAPTAVSRAAGLALTKVLANEAAPFGVLVNALHVGLIDSDQWVRRHAAAPDSGSYEDYLKAMAKGVPLGRVGRAEEFANVACFLASDLASYVAGVSINVDGGKSPVV